MRKNKGITLIALIITIIILIILTAITLNNVIGTDLIGFATKAAENYIDAARDEADKLDKLAEIADNLGVGEDSIVRAGEIVTETKKDNYTDAQGRHATIPEGFKVSTKTSEQYIKDGLVIQDSDGNEFVWIPCYYGETKPENAPKDLQEYKKHTYQDQADTNGLVVEKGGSWKTHYYTSFKDWFDEAIQKIDNSKIVEDEDAYGNKSVNTYGGFYVGRYEAGLPEEWQPDLTHDKPIYGSTIERNDTGDKKPISKANKFSWNFISQTNAKSVSEKMYEGSESVDSKLVDGTAWDTTINWIATSNVDVTKSKSYGNYMDNTSIYTGWYAEHLLGSIKDQNKWNIRLKARHFINGPIKLTSVDLGENDLWEKRKENYIDSETYDITKNDFITIIEIPTGSYEEFKLKNIYDLAGNMWEWTNEVGNHKQDTTSNGNGSFAVFRGGTFEGSSADYPLNFRHGNHSSSNSRYEFIGFRVVLYIK